MTSSQPSSGLQQHFNTLSSVFSPASLDVSSAQDPFEVEGIEALDRTVAQDQVNTHYHLDYF